jgi:hypothetical protein
MVRSVSVRLAATFLAALACTGTALPGDDSPKGFTAEGKLVLPSHKVKMEKDQIHVIEVKATGFTPKVMIPGVFLPGPLFAFGQPPRHDCKEIFTPRETKEYQISVFPDFRGGVLPTGTFAYTLSIRPLVLSQKPLLKITDMITDKDQKYGQRNSYYKPFLIKLKAGKTYVIDHVRPGEDFKFDPYLYLEDANKKIVAEDDDSGGNLNARIVFTPQTDGEFRIIATTLSPSTGEFTLTVRGTESPANTEKK